MPRTNLSMWISADGYVAGPDQSEEHPLGVGGQLLHGWHIGAASDHPLNKQIVSEMMDGMGAHHHGAQHVRAGPGRMGRFGLDRMVGR